MRSIGFRATGCICALLASVAPVAAAAEECVPQEDVSDGVIYAMPLVVDALSTKCADSLATDGFLATEGAAFSGKFAERQAQAWPGAFRLLAQFADRSRSPESADEESFAEMFDELPDDAVRPFFDAFVTAEVQKVIPLKECANIERGISLLAPLPPENIGGLLAFMFDVTGVKDPSICPFESE